ncbi:TOMM40L, partial [Cordylochernes scorpioides]
MYSVGRRTKRWPLCLFFNFLDVVAINSAVIYKAVNQDEVFPLPFEGIRFIVNKNLSSHFQVSHSLHMGPAVSGYKFMATYVGTKQVGPNESYPVLISDIDPDGNLNANVIHMLRPGLRSKFVTQILQGQWVASQITGEYHGSDFTAALALINPAAPSGMLLVAHYLQSVGPRLDLGGELACQPGGQTAIVSLAARYSGESYTVSGTLNSVSSHLCYYRSSGKNLQEHSPVLQLGAEVETNWMTNESVCSLGYQLEVPLTNTTFRGMLTSNWTVSAVMEKKLLPLPFTFALCASLNHLKNQCRLGCAF